MLTEPPPVCLRIVFNLTAFTDDPIVAWRLNAVRAVGEWQCVRLLLRSLVYSDCSDLSSNIMHVDTFFCFHFYCLRLTRLTFNKS